MFFVMVKNDPYKRKWVYETKEQAIQMAKNMAESYFPSDFIVVDENENTIFES